MVTDRIKQFLKKIGIDELRPAQKKALDAGLLQENNLLICTPTASGKTLIAEMAAIHWHEKKKKLLYVVPLKALGSEKYREFSERHDFVTKLSIGDFDSSDKDLVNADVIIATAEKLDSLLRHDVPWLSRVGALVIDEIHLLNDSSRGPTLEILITMIRKMSNPQIIGLSATIGNPEELASWLDAKLVLDDWRPVRLDKGVYVDGKISFPPHKPF